MENKAHHNISTVALTPQRAAVFQAVRESETHFTAEEVYQAAKRILPSISYATVYNSLRWLKNGGLIAEIKFGSGASRYDAILERHDHALCAICGKLVDIKLDLSKELMRLAAERSGFEPHSIQLTLNGLCENCRVN